MIAAPHNDRACLGAITDQVVQLVETEDPALVAIAEEHPDTASLAAWIRSLPQRDDEGIPGDGPKVGACRPPQRLQIPSDAPNCVERSAIYSGAAELIDPEPVRRLATISTPQGLHTFPTEDGEPVILDPYKSRNALRAGLFRMWQTRNVGPVALSPTAAVDWIAELAAEPSLRFTGGVARVRNGHQAVRALLAGRPLCIADVRDVAFVLALAEREARQWGPTGVRIVESTAHAIDRLDRDAARQWMAARCAPRNAPELRIGKARVRPNVPLLAALGRVGGRLGGQVGVEALRIKLATLGVTPPVLNTIERELNREGLSLGPLAQPAPMLGTLGALTPEALAGRWLAHKI
jgi:hypothetical protein